MILVASPSKPFEYTTKNTPRRNAVVELYEDEIESAYEAVEESSQIDVCVPQTWEEAECLWFARVSVERIMKLQIADDEDIFQAGCDRCVSAVGIHGYAILPRR